MDDKQLERELLNYLASDKKERVSMFDQLKGLGNASQRILHQLELHQQKDDAAFAALADHIKGLASRVTAVEADAADTGRHDITRLQAELAERKQVQQGLAQSFINAGIGAIIAIIGGLLAMLVTYMLRPSK